MTRKIQPSKWVAIARTSAWTECDARCVYCMAKLSRSEVTADHIHPRAKGGTDTSENITAACRWCNGTKGKMSADAFRRLLKSKAPASLNVEILRTIRRIHLQAGRACKRIEAFAR